MKRTFTKEYLLANRGCYSREEVEALPFINNKRITLKTLFDGLPLKDFNWVVITKCELTVKQRQLFALHCAKQALPIYEKEYPNDSRVRDCIDTTERYINGNATIDEFTEKKRAAADAADVAAADAAAAYVAAAYVAAAYAAAAYAAYAAYTVDYGNYAYAPKSNCKEFKASIWEFIKTLK